MLAPFGFQESRRATHPPTQDQKELAMNLLHLALKGGGDVGSGVPACFPLLQNQTNQWWLLTVFGLQMKVLQGEGETALYHPPRSLHQGHLTPSTSL